MIIKLVFVALFTMHCVEAMDNIDENKYTGKTMTSHTFPYDAITEIFPDIFMITDAHKIHHDGADLQHSCNMIIVRNPNTQGLSLINTIRLDTHKIDALNNLGKIENIVRIGAFHDCNDGLYLEQYPEATLWALQGMQHKNERPTDMILHVNGKMPFPSCSLFVFETSIHPEGALLIDQKDGILVTCDSIKNWIAPDKFFNDTAASGYQQQNFFGTATLSPIWVKACHVDVSDFKRLQSLRFSHLLSAHGEALLNTAQQQLAQTIEHTFKI